MGTSRPSLKGMNANPRSIVMPRSRSSLRRSGMNARQRFHQGALAVVDVACRTYGEMGHDTVTRSVRPCTTDRFSMLAFLPMTARETDAPSPISAPAMITLCSIAAPCPIRTPGPIQTPGPIRQRSSSAVSSRTTGGLSTRLGDEKLSAMISGGTVSRTVDSISRSFDSRYASGVLVSYGSYSGATSSPRPPRAPPAHPGSNRRNMFGRRRRHSRL